MIDWEGTDEEVAAAIRARGVETDLGDEELVAVATAARGDIAARGYGPLDALNFTLYGLGHLLPLPHAAASVSAIVEEDIALTDGTHYRLTPGGLYLERLYAGYPSVWNGRVTGTIAASATDDRYDRVVVDIVKLTLEYSGLARRRDGDYSEDAIGARDGGTAGSYAEERAALIEQLAPATVPFA
jgi:hypothetical protein